MSERNDRDAVSENSLESLFPSGRFASAAARRAPRMQLATRRQMANHPARPPLIRVDSPDSRQDAPSGGNENNRDWGGSVIFGRPSAIRDSNPSIRTAELGRAPIIIS